jgi:integrase
MPKADDARTLTVGELVQRYLAHAEVYYRDSDGKQTGEAANMEAALKVWFTFHISPDLPINHFSKHDLRVVQQAMIDDERCRRYINQTISRIRRMFVWAVEEDIIEDTIDDALASRVLGVFESVKSLKAGRSKAVEKKPIQSVSLEDVRDTLPYLKPKARDACELMLRTGARVSEILRLTVGEIVKHEGDWYAVPEKHKNAWRGHGRALPLDQAAMRIVRRNIDRNLFGKHNDKQVLFPSRSGKSYSVHGFRSVLKAAIERANRDRDTHKVPQWRPQQVRHTTAEIARALSGLEDTQALLGHRSRAMTEHYTGPTTPRQARRAAKAVSGHLREVL